MGSEISVCEQSVKHLRCIMWTHAYRENCADRVGVPDIDFHRQIHICYNCRIFLLHCGFYDTGMMWQPGNDSVLTELGLC